MKAVMYIQNHKSIHAGIVQLVERLLAKEKVTGPSPVARSKDQVL